MEVDAKSVKNLISLRLPSSVAVVMSFQSASVPYKNALELQDCLMAEARKKDCPAQVKPQLARAYVELEKLKRIMRGKPANTSQSIKSEPVPRTRKSDTGPLEPIPE